MNQSELNDAVISYDNVYRFPFFSSEADEPVRV